MKGNAWWWIGRPLRLHVITRQCMHKWLICTCFDAGTTDAAACTPEGADCLPSHHRATQTGMQKATGAAVVRGSRCQQAQDWKAELVVRARPLRGFA